MVIYDERRMISAERLGRLEWALRASHDSRAFMAGVGTSTVLEMIERIRFLEARQTELQERNTELVLENRELKQALKEIKEAIK